MKSEESRFMMRQDSVVYQQPVGEVLGECRKIAKQQSLVIVRT